MANNTHDALIIGGGPGGSATAINLLERGVKPAIVEPVPFPRYHIGESLTGECGGIMRRFGFAEQMDAARFPVKHGVNVFGPSGQSTFWVPVMMRKDGKLQSTTTWQVRRSEFDRMLMERALDMGAELLPWDAVEPIVEENRVAGLRCRTPEGAQSDVRAKVVIDASGQSAFLANRGMTSPIERGRYDKQVAIFSQVRDAIRDEGPSGGNTLIFYRRQNHWAWFIPLDDDSVSVGVVVPSSYFKDAKLSQEDFLKRELRELNPELTRRITNIDLIDDVRAVSNYSYEVEHFTGPRHLCVGDSHRFIDPIFSFGVNFALREADFAAQAVSDFLGGRASDPENPFQNYEERSNRAQDMIQDLVDCFWAHPLTFAIFAHNRYREDIIDLFAGRIYEEHTEISPGLKAIRQYLQTHGREDPESRSSIIDA